MSAFFQFGILLIGIVALLTFLPDVLKIQNLKTKWGVFGSMVVVALILSWALLQTVRVLYTCGGAQ